MGHFCSRWMIQLQTEGLSKGMEKVPLVYFPQCWSQLLPVKAHRVRSVLKERNSKWPGRMGESSRDLSATAHVIAEGHY